jgi:hypothetical protein
MVKIIAFYSYCSGPIGNFLLLLVVIAQGTLRPLVFLKVIALGFITSHILSNKITALFV